MSASKHAPHRNRRLSAGEPPLELRRALHGRAYQPRRWVEARAATSAPRPWRRVLRWTLGLAVTLTLLTAIWVGGKFIVNEVRLFGWRGLWGLIWPEKLHGEETGRVNILLAGNSADDSGHDGALLTDSIMILSVDTVNHTAFLLSVPRDLYVDIPGYDYAKINEAYRIGEESGYSETGYPSGGMGLLEQTVAERFGITLDYYALVDYAAVRDAVNAVGGIDITIKSDDPRGLYDPSIDYANHHLPLVDLSNGTHHLDGAQALGLARARGHEYGSYGYGASDFQRTANQQQIIIGLKERATSLGTLANPIKLGELFDSAGNNVQTDLSLGNVRRLYTITKQIPSSGITPVSLNDTAKGTTDLLEDYTTPYGQSALIPAAGLDDYTGIQNFVTSLLGQ